MITHKENIINYFKSGIKEVKNFKIGIEHENFYLIKKQINVSTTPLYLKCFQL